MNWLSRSLWIVAWACWLWLGAALYRELPRRLPPPIGRLPTGENEAFLGWLPGGPIAVFEERGEEPKFGRFRTWNALTGEIVGPFESPGKHPTVSVRHGKVLCGDAVLDLRTGERIAVKRLDHPEFAPTKARVLCWRQQKNIPPRRIDGVLVAEDPDERDWRVTVVDLNDGRELLRVTNAVGEQPNRDLSGAFFIDDDAIGIFTDRILGADEESSPDDSRVEVWRVDSPTKPIHVAKGVESHFDVSVSASGRIACHEVGTTPGHVDVFDLYAGRMVLSTPPKQQRKTNPGGSSGLWLPPVLSIDGRSVYVPMARKLLEVDTGKTLWSSDSFFTLSVSESRRQVVVLEEWSFERLPFLPKFETFAIRDMNSLRLVHRTWAPTGEGSEVSNSSDEWYIDGDGLIYRLNPQVDWLLLAGCQLVLAAPLVAVWAWRRRKSRKR